MEAWQDGFSASDNDSDGIVRLLFSLLAVTAQQVTSRLGLVVLTSAPRRNLFFEGELALLSVDGYTHGNVVGKRGSSDFGPCTESSTRPCDGCAIFSLLSAQVCCGCRALGDAHRKYLRKRGEVCAVPVV